jgi:hypothetical protein
MDVRNGYNEEEFSELVAMEAKGQAHEGVSMYLRDPENVERWYQALVDIKKNLQVQFISLRAQMDEAREEGFRTGNKSVFFGKKADIEKKRRNVNLFGSSIDKRIAEAKKLVKEYRIQKSTKDNAGITIRMKKLLQRADALIPYDFTDWHRDWDQLKGDIYGNE